MNTNAILTVLSAMGCVYMAQAMHIIHDHDGYKVVTHERIVRVNSHDVSPLLRNMDARQLLSFIKHGGRIRVHQLSDGNFFLRDHTPGPGGCPSRDILHIICLSALGTLAVTCTAKLASPEAELIAYCAGISVLFTYASLEVIAHIYGEREAVLPM